MNKIKLKEIIKKMLNENDNIDLSIPYGEPYTNQKPFHRKNPEWEPNFKQSFTNFKQKEPSGIEKTIKKWTSNPIIKFLKDRKIDILKDNPIQGGKVTLGKVGKYKTGNQYSKPSDLGFSPSSDIYGVKFTYNLPTEGLKKAIKNLIKEEEREGATGLQKTQNVEPSQKKPFAALHRIVVDKETGRQKWVPNDVYDAEYKPEWESDFEKDIDQLKKDFPGPVKPNKTPTEPKITLPEPKDSIKKIEDILNNPTHKLYQKIKLQTDNDPDWRNKMRTITT
tara:strand:+ start:209 stop:1045 length:837 start_codon:yes stop_codon:yes gene_type:complete